jgi:hypothetical protein
MKPLRVGYSLSYLSFLSVTMSHGQLSFLSVQISPALFPFAEFVVDKAKNLHLRLMQSELGPQEAAKRRVTVLSRLLETTRWLASTLAADDETSLLFVMISVRACTCVNSFTHLYLCVVTLIFFGGFTLLWLFLFLI